MLFSSESERMQHPQGSLIPSLLWFDEYFFHEELSSLALTLMQTPTGELKKTVQAGTYRNKTSNELSCLGLSIAFAHPDLEDQELLDLIKEMGLSKKQLFRYACVLGRLSFFDKVINQYSLNEQRELLAADSYLAFRLTAQMGHLALIERCIDLALEQVLSMITAKDYEAFFNAASNGHLAVMERLIRVAPEQVQAMIAAKNYAVFRSSAINGALAVMERLIVLVDPEQVQAMITSNNYEAFFWAARDNDFPVMEYLIALVAPEQLQTMIVARDYEAFCEAGANGHLAVMQRLMALAPGQMQAMITARNFEAFKKAAQNGHLEVIEYLLSLVPEQAQAMIAANDYAPFCVAAMKGRLAVIERLITEITPEEVSAMMAASHYAVFRHAAIGGHSAVVGYFSTLIAPEQVQAMIAAKNYEAFCGAASKGYLAVIEHFIALAPPEQMQSMIENNDYYSFRGAAMNGNVAVIERLITLVTAEKVQAMIVALDYEAFRMAARNGHLGMIELLIALAPEQVQSMLAAKRYDAFCWAAKDGHAAIIERLIALVAPEHLQTMIGANKYAAFREAAKNGHFAVFNLVTEEQLQTIITIGNYAVFRNAAGYGHFRLLEHIIAFASAEQVQSMIAAKNYNAFRKAAENNDLCMMERLMMLAPEQVQAMIAANNYAAFRVGGDDLAIVKRLITLVASEHLENMLASGNYQAFHLIASANKLRLINHLLSFPLIFAHAELHENEYGQDYVHPFVSAKLLALRTQKISTEQAAPNAIFDLENAQEAKLCFYFLRNLIRRNDSAQLDNLRFLLEIPAVKTMVHRAVSSQEENELLRLAIRIGNQQAAELLLTLPQVHRLAVRNNYYPQEAQGHINLRVLAQDRESSMKALSTEEEKQLQAIIDRYQPRLKTRGTSNLMAELRKKLEASYAQNPANLGENVTLPMSWQGFQALNLSDSEREEALKAYYQNKEHSAWRYLSKPNRWMHARASYVCVNPQNSTETCSTFEDYQPLIALLYLAVLDEEMPACDGYTLETRLEHFIDELAHIGRAHNWDKTRANKKGEEEEFDDLEGDRPSCYSGVKRRLFQSLLGHPLFQMLTKDLLAQEIRDLALPHFRRLITPSNRPAIKKAWDESILLEENEEEKDEERNNRIKNNLALLKSLDIAAENQQVFWLYLEEKYGAKFSESNFLKKFILQTFALQNDEAHLLKFAYLGVERLLQEPSPAALITQIGFRAVSVNPRTQAEEKKIDSLKSSLI